MLHWFLTPQHLTDEAIRKLPKVILQLKCAESTIQNHNYPANMKRNVHIPHTFLFLIIPYKRPYVIV